MEKHRFDKLGIEIEISTEKADFFEIKESKNCVKVSHKGARIATILPDSKIEFLNIGYIVVYKGRIVVFGDTFVEAGGLSRVFARDKACVVASQGAEVRANGRAKVRALDNSRVIAGGRAKIWLDGESKGYKKASSRVRMNKISDRAAIVNMG